MCVYVYVYVSVCMRVCTNIICISHQPYALEQTKHRLRRIVFVSILLLCVSKEMNKAIGALVLLYSIKYLGYTTENHYC